MDQIVAPNTEPSSSLDDLATAIYSTDAVSGLTHSYYRYPARFSPEFARETILSFTSPGDLVLDPFMGGGTVAVESLVAGRAFVGCDVSSLSTFVSRVKTTPLTIYELEEIDLWFDLMMPSLNTWKGVQRPESWIEMGYQRNLGDRSTWRLRKLLEQATWSVGLLDSENAQRFARCVILRTGQWALDGRRTIPRVADFRARMRENYQKMRDGMAAYVAALGGDDATRSASTALLLNRSAEGLDTDPLLSNMAKPKLIVTSPPYPGVYVTYHRWKVKGRRETPAPFWIAESLDGSGLAHYTMGWRQEPGLKTYWRRLASVLGSLHALCAPDTTVVQIVGFAEPEEQLPLYLLAMRSAGFEELHVPGINDENYVWRNVPGRRWYAAYQETARSTSKEVVLFHRPSAS